MRDSVILSNQAPLEIPFQQRAGWVPGQKRNTCQTDLSQGNVRSTDVISHCLLNNIFPLPTVWLCLFHFCLHLIQLQKSPWFKKKDKSIFKARKALEKGRPLEKMLFFVVVVVFCILLHLIPTVSVFCLRTLQDRNTFHTYLWLSFLSRGTTWLPIYYLLNCYVAVKLCQAWLS